MLQTECKFRMNQYIKHEMFYETLDNVESEKVPCPDVGEWVCQVPRL